MTPIDDDNVIHPRFGLGRQEKPMLKVQPGDLSLSRIGGHAPQDRQTVLGANGIHELLCILERQSDKLAARYFPGRLPSEITEQLIGKLRKEPENHDCQVVLFHQRVSARLMMELMSEAEVTFTRVGELLDAAIASTVAMYQREEPKLPMPGDKLIHGVKELFQRSFAPEFGSSAERDMGLR